MVLDLLIEYREGLSVAELTNKIIEEYGLEEAAYEETLGKDVRQTVRGQVRRVLEALTEIGEYLDLEKEGCGKNTTFWKQYGVELVDKRERRIGCSMENSIDCVPLHTQLRMASFPMRNFAFLCFPFEGASLSMEHRQVRYSEN